MSVLKKIKSLFTVLQRSDGTGLDIPDPVPPHLDELVGMWKKEDDGGNLIVWGWALEFHEDGTGFHHYWGYDEPAMEPVMNYHFRWERLDGKTIRIRPETETEWKTIQYTITEYWGNYSVKYDKLSEVGYTPTEYSKEGFWVCLEPLLRGKSF